MKTYTLKVAGLTRELPLCPVSDDLEIAAFIMLSDVELTVKTAEELLKRCPDFDVIRMRSQKQKARIIFYFRRRSRFVHDKG